MIKYTCDNCGQEVFEIEALGPGVIDTTTGQPLMGKAYIYTEEASGIELVITIARTGSEHFCKACMWETLVKMIGEYGPKTVSILEAMVDDLSKTKWVGSSAGMFKGEAKHFHIKDVAGLPKGPFVAQVMEIPDEETDSGTSGTDTELSELYAEGSLSETGPDEPADDPGTARASTVFNFDDRPGWQFHSTAKGI